MRKVHPDIIMEEKYQKYNIEQLLEDRQFVAWILEDDGTGWENFQKSTSKVSSELREAREIILMLRDDYDLLDDNSVVEIWRNIKTFESTHTSKVRFLKIRKSLQWAASVLLVISLGATGFWYFNSRNDTGYNFISENISGETSEATIVLPDGEEVPIAEDNSTVSINKNKELVINNKDVIDLGKRETGKVHESKMAEIVIPYGKKSEILLADGTKVWLNAGSRLAFPTKFTGKTREVFLSGEACFKVAKNKEQPFIVNACQIEIKVLGTHFNVSTYPSDPNIETVLLEGSISLSSKNSLGFGKNEVLLEPSQKAVFKKENRDLVVTDVPDAEMYIAWTEGWLQFSRESLQSVFTKLERFYNIQIQIPDNFPSSELISGKLDLKDSLEEVLLALSDVAKIDYRISNDNVFINKKLNKMQSR